MDDPLVGAQLSLVSGIDSAVWEMKKGRINTAMNSPINEPDVRTSDNRSETFQTCTPTFMWANSHSELCPLWCNLLATWDPLYSSLFLNLTRSLTLRLGNYWLEIQQKMHFSYFAEQSRILPAAFINRTALLPDFTIDCVIFPQLQVIYCRLNLQETKFTAFTWFSTSANLLCTSVSYRERPDKEHSAHSLSKANWRKMPWHAVHLRLLQEMARDRVFQAFKPALTWARCPPPVFDNKQKKNISGTMSFIAHCFPCLKTVSRQRVITK